MAIDVGLENSDRATRYGGTFVDVECIILVISRVILLCKIPKSGCFKWCINGFRSSSCFPSN